MQISKKLYTTLIITVLTISTIIAAIPMASALSTAPGLYVPATVPTTAISSGSVGTKVCVVGNATHGAASPFSTVTVYWDNLAGAVLGTVAADAAGAYKLNVTIPSAYAGSHYIVAKDDGAAQGALFTITTSLSASAVPPTAPPVRVLPGDSVLLKGNGFAPNSAVTVVLNSTTLGTPVGIAITTPIITTNGTGSFEATITIPLSMTASQFDIYDVTATDAATNTATTQITINYYVTVTPSTGPTGITTTIAGRIAPNTAYELRFNGAQITTGTSSATGSYSYGYTIPGVLSPAGYLVEIVWETTNTRSTTFTVTTAPTISLSASSGVAGTIVTVSGSGFSGSANITLYFGSTIVNSTTMNAAFGPTTIVGAFSALKFVVPTITPGVYAVKVVDQYGATSAAGVFFTINPTPVTQIALRGTTYYPGDIFSFNIRTTESSLGSINVTIYDPSGEIWWRTNGMWTLTLSDDGTYSTVIFQNQGADDYNQMRMMLPADAPLGTWNWTIVYTPASTAPVSAKATGLFTVVALPGMQDVLDRLDELEASITDVVTTTEGDIIAVINTKSGQIMTSIDAIGPQLQAITDTAVVIATDVGEVKTAISNLDLGTMGVDITAIKSDVATIKTNIGTVNTAVSNLDAKVVSVQGDLATVQTTLGTLEGKITSIDGTTATIETDVGTLQADVSGIPSKVDMTPAWIAVVLALIAAIAAIFAVITIRQKIAG
jgi:hypothetical protein